MSMVAMDPYMIGRDMIMGIMGDRKVMYIPIGHGG